MVKFPTRYKWDPKISNKCTDVLSSTYINRIVEQANQTLQAGLIE